MNNIDIKRLIPHIIALIAFILMSIIYFYPQLQGKSIRSGDTNTYVGMAKESIDFKKETGESTLWTNSMFGGMPTYQISSPQSNNIFKTIQTVLYTGFSRPIGYFIFGSLSCYLMLIIFGVNPWLSIFGAIGFSFMTNHMVLYEAGHMSKIISIMSSPVVVAGLWALFRKKYLLGSLAFTLGLGLNITANHYQMTYYLAILLGIYFIMEMVSAIKKGDTGHLAKIVGICALSCIIALGATASKMLPTYEYSKDTMRGSPILKSEGAINSSSETEGLDFNYAMNWSNGIIDLFSSFIPGVAGGGSAESVTNKSEFVKGLKKLGNSTDKAPLYWGSLPGTSGPVYFGAIFFFLMILGAMILKGPIKWWVLTAVGLTLILSLGKNFEVINRIFFDYFPLYNKFRTPNSVLSVTAVIIPILAMLGLQQIFDSKNKSDYTRPLLISTGIMAVICLFFALIGPGFFDFSSRVDANYAQYGLDKALVADRKSLMRSDSLRSLVLILIMAAALYAFLKDKLSSAILICVFGVLMLFDQIGVSKRYLDTQSFINSPNANADFKPRPVDTQILTDSDPHFRVFDQTIDPWNSSFSSYFHKTIGGMHAAKLQRINDLIGRHISKGNQRVLNMMNTKYYIMPGENNAAEARLNTAALGNAWFVNSIKTVTNANEEIDALASFDPAGEAIVHQEFSDYVSGLNLSKNGTIKLLDYKPNNLTYESNATGDQFAVFSEMWYGPNKGWQAYLDGEKVEHIRVNYALRGMKIPSGNHRISFVFDPKVYQTGKTISLISSMLFGIGLIGMIGLWYKRRETAFDEIEHPTKHAIANTEKSVIKQDEKEVRNAENVTVKAKSKKKYKKKKRKKKD